MAANTEPLEREQFTFYASYARAIAKIKKASDRCAAYDAIANYALYEILPDIDKLPDSAAIAFELIKPTLDTGRRKAASGKTGGEAKGTKKQDESKPEANEKQTAREKEGEVEKEGEKEVEIEKENESYISPLTPMRREQMIYDALQDRRADLPKVVCEWVQYKIEKRQPYKETGLKALLTQIRNSADKYGDAAVVDVIRRSMSANYQGIVFDWLKKQRPNPQQAADTDNIFLQIYEEEHGNDKR